MHDGRRHVLRDGAIGVLILGTLALAVAALAKYVFAR
jgi:hypothetical protein